MASKTAPQKPKNSTDAFARRLSNWRRERRKLDLDLEQAPLESRFSPQLADLMSREEAIAAARTTRTRLCTSTLALACATSA